MSSKLMDRAVEAAMKAGKFLNEHINDIDIEVEFKKKDDPVTEMDRRAETIIVDCIREEYPDHSFLGEEHGEKGTSEYKWIIDPIDGTKNFIEKQDGFTVSIGLEHKGELIIGVIYAPTLDLLFSAEKGKGAFLNGESICVNDVRSKEDAKVLVRTGHCKDKDFGKKVREIIFKEFPGAFNLFKLEYFETFGWTHGSAAIELAMLAKGEIDAVINFGQKPWDVAAGIVIVKEACGVITDLKGEEKCIENKELVAANAILQKQILDVIKTIS